MYSRILSPAAIGTALLAGTMLLASNAAQALPSGTYVLGSHPDGGEAPPTYGLRLDHLFGGSEVYTFDFSHASSAMFMDYDGTSIHKSSR